MELRHLELTRDGYERLNSKYPEGNGSSLIGKRAEEIVKIYFQRKDPRCQFAETPPKGADLQVALPGEALAIEVKGTKSADVASQQLKVSSQHSRDLLEKGAPVYRVTGVFERSPSIYALPEVIGRRYHRDARGGR